jgi:hypothetical protein
LVELGQLLGKVLQQLSGDKFGLYYIVARDARVMVDACLSR